MNIGALWDQLVGAVCRPPRDLYEESDLVGGNRAAFSFGESRARIKKYYRQDVELLNTRNQRLQCSHYRPCVVTSSDGRLPCVIYCHTNSGSRRDAEEILFTLLPKGITVFALDFSGSGKSDGNWVTLGAHEVEDLATVVQYIRDEGSTSTLALWGRSMGAVTALLYSHRDPSIAGIVVDSPFSKLTDLMFELATDSQQGLSVPRPLVKVALTMMKRSVRRKADFNIDDVAPLDLAKEMYVPVLFGHAKEDSFIPMHHSERLFEAHGADTKNFINFEGDHNGARPEFWYDSGLIFLLGVLRVEELVGPDIDLHSIDLENAPHLRGGGIYVARGGSGGGGGAGGDEEEEEEGEAQAVLVGSGRTRAVAAPWDISNSRISSAVIERPIGVHRGSLGDRTTSIGSDSSNNRTRGATGLTSTGNVSDYIDYGDEEGDVIDDEEEAGERRGAEEESEDAIMQRVIALSLAEARASSSSSSPQQQQPVVEGRKRLATDVAPLLRELPTVAEGGIHDEYDEEAALEAAIAESLKTSTTSSSPAACALPAEVTTATTDLLTHQSAVTEHSRKEADAVHIAVDSVHHRLEDLISLNGEEEQCMKEMLEDEEKKTATAAEKAVATAAVQEGLVNEPAVDEEQQLEEYLEQLRAQSARLSGNK